MSFGRPAPIPRLIRPPRSISLPVVRPGCSLLVSARRFLPICFLPASLIAYSPNVPASYPLLLILAIPPCNISTTISLYTPPFLDAASTQPAQLAHLHLLSTADRAMHPTAHRIPPTPDIPPGCFQNRLALSSLKRARILLLLHSNFAIDSKFYISNTRSILLLLVSRGSSSFLSIISGRFPLLLYPFTISLIGIICD